MSKYIDRAALFNSLSGAKTVEEIFAAIQAAPEADVQEIRRGRWTTERTIEHDGEIYCDQCGWTWENLTFDRTKVKKSPYCPNCGAAMNEEE